MLLETFIKHALPPKNIDLISFKRIIIMAGIKIVGVNEIQKGSYMMIEGIACKVNDVAVSRPGKHGHAKFRIVGIGLLDGKKKEVVMPHADVEVPIVEKKNAQVLSIRENIANIMDLDSYETFDLEIPEELKAEIKDGSNILYWEILDVRVMKQIRAD
jgi:translation initiation factor 5A